MNSKYRKITVRLKRLKSVLWALGIAAFVVMILVSVLVEFHPNHSTYEYSEP